MSDPSPRAKRQREAEIKKAITLLKKFRDEALRAGDEAAGEDLHRAILTMEAMP